MAEEQKKIRTGKFCASSIHKLMGAKGLGKTGETYVHEVAAEYLTGEPAQPAFKSAATDWGINHEAEAKHYYEAATGQKIDKADTIILASVAGTPDGIVTLEKTGIEIKCPYNSGNHLRNLRLTTAEELKDLHPEYYWQIVAYMMLTGLKDWKYCSYDPRFKEEKRMLILNMKENPQEALKLIERVQEATEIFGRLIS
jgi:hypothetical protein